MSQWEIEGFGDYIFGFDDIFYFFAFDDTCRENCKKET